MEELRKVALTYYSNGTDRDKDLFAEFFHSLDTDGNGHLDLNEFSQFLMHREEYDFIPTATFFSELDRDGSNGLDYDEVVTLYYIVKSGRPFCRQCSRFISGLYFTCMKCFNTESSRYCICHDCFCGYRSSCHSHGLENFLDNFALLEDKRKSAIAAKNRQKQMSASTSGSSSPGAVPTTSQTTASTSGSSPPGAVPTTSQNSAPVHFSNQYHQMAIVPAASNRINKWLIAVKVLDLGLNIASLAANCTIM